MNEQGVPLLDVVRQEIDRRWREVVWRSGPGYLAIVDCLDPKNSCELPAGLMEEAAPLISQAVKNETEAVIAAGIVMNKMTTWTRLGEDCEYQMYNFGTPVQVNVRLAIELAANTRELQRSVAVELSLGRPVCNLCGGSRLKTCPDCHGTARETCDFCHGSGNHPFDPGECYSCEGSGKVRCTRCGEKKTVLCDCAY